jgi:hypothetical protein
MTTVRPMILAFCALLAVASSGGASAATTDTPFDTTTSKPLGHWQRIELQPASRASQVAVLIQTDGPRMIGLIRIPGAPASNFDTGSRKTVVDLINAGDEAGGYAEITALEVLFTQAASGQPFLIAPIGYVK